MMRSVNETKKIGFLTSRFYAMTQDVFCGVMHYARRHPEIYVRPFEPQFVNGKPIMEFGDFQPDGLIVCNLPIRRVSLHKFGTRIVPIVAFAQQPIPVYEMGFVCLDSEGIANAAIDLFARRGCQSVGYLGGSIPPEIRTAQAIGDAFARQADQAGLAHSAFRLHTYWGPGVSAEDGRQILNWVLSTPKPFGIFAFDDAVAATVLDICRLNGIDVPGTVYVLGMDNSRIVCENTYPPLSSIELDYRQTAFRAMQALDDLICRRIDRLPLLTCGVASVVERESTLDEKGVGFTVRRALAFIRDHACRDGGLTESDVAAYLKVSVRTLQMRFREAAYERTVQQEIQAVRLNNVCHLLTYTGRPITEITFMSGFGSQSHLKAVFKRRYGKTMREYRNENNPPPSSNGGGG